MNLNLALAPAIATMLVLPQLASAGPLAKTARAIDNKSSSSSSKSTGSSGASSSGHSRGERPREDRSRGNYSSGSTSTTYVSAGSAYCEGCGTEASPLRLPVPTVELGLAGQKVRGSDGSIRLDARMLFGRIGLYTSGDYYFEQVNAPADPKTMMDARSEHVRVNLFELSLLGRLLDTKGLQADVHAGLGVAASSVFATLPGSAVGVTLQAQASELVSLRVEGRAMALRHNIRAYEGATGVQWRELWLGYRALQFDVGEVLHGPEAGLRFHF
jgi:hypothetical protein